MSRQVIVIHGGDTFDTYEEYISFLKNFKLDFKRFQSKSWKDTLPDNLGKVVEVISPEMPNPTNAKYIEWKIWFEKFIPYLREDLIFVGHSLGGIFLAKYLSENDFPKKITATFLVSAPFDDNDKDYSLVDFSLPDSLNNLQKQGGEIHIYHSSDDKIVPFEDLNKYKKVLPGAMVREFGNRGHFQQEEFPEIIEEIKNLLTSP
jgi:uncharacterized protein